MSLGEVAGRAGVSVATLSRIETEKQSISVELLIELASIIGENPGALVSGDGHDGPASRRDLVRDLANRSASERAGIIALATKESRRGRAQHDALSAQIDNLLATIDLIVDEINELRKQVRRKN